MKIAIASGKGGVGKSMLASALAMLYAQDRRIVAADCDSDTPNLAIWLGGVSQWDKKIPVIASSRPEIDYNKCSGCGLCANNCRFGALSMSSSKPRLNRFLCEGCGACEAICPQKAIKLKPVQNGEIRVKRLKYDLSDKRPGGSHTDFFLVSGRLLPGKVGSGRVVSEIKKQAEKYKHDLMVIDSAPGTGCPVIASLRDADLAVLITEPTLSGFSDLKKVLAVVKFFKLKWGLVINKWNINPALTRKMADWSGQRFLGKISYDKAVFQAIADLTPILKTGLKARREIKTIYSKLRKNYG